LLPPAKKLVKYLAAGRQGAGFYGQLARSAVQAQRRGAAPATVGLDVGVKAHFRSGIISFSISGSDADAGIWLG
jgi:hypothetical protein